MRGDFLRRRKHAERINQKYRAFRVFISQRIWRGKIIE
jgi:hypothetical protein